MNWSENDFGDLPKEIEWDDKAAKDKKVQQWRDLWRIANGELKKVAYALIKVEQQSRLLAQSLYPEIAVDKSQSLLDTDLWRNNHPGITLLYERLTALIEDIGRQKDHLKMAANTAERLVDREAAQRRPGQESLLEKSMLEIERSRHLAEPLLRQIKMLTALSDCIDSWLELPASGQVAADQSLKELIAPVSNIFANIHKLSNSLAPEIDIDAIQNVVFKVTRQTPVLQQMAERTAEEFSDTAKRTGEAFSPSVVEPLGRVFPEAREDPAQEISQKIFGDVVEDMPEEEALRALRSLRTVSRPFQALVDSMPDLQEVKIRKSLENTNDAIRTAANKRNKNFTVDILKKLVEDATTGVAHVGLDLTAIPEQYRDTVLDIVLSQPRKTVAIKASGITPVSGLIDKLQEFNLRYPSKCKDLRLDLSDTNLHSNDLQSLVGLPITALNIAHNPQIDGNGFQYIGSLNTLIVLDVSNNTNALLGNGVLDFKLALENMKNLRAIHLNDVFPNHESALSNNLLAAVADKIKDSLEVFSFRGNGANYISAMIIGRLTNLRRLDISNNPNVLREGDFDDRRFSASPEESLTFLKKLTHLIVSNTGLNATAVDAGAEFIISREASPSENYLLPHLRHFDASNNGITEGIEHELIGHPTLEEINLRGNVGYSFSHNARAPLSEECLHRIAWQMPKLKQLNDRDVKGGILAPDFTAKSQSPETRHAVSSKGPSHGRR